MINESNDVKVSIVVPVYNVEKYLNRCMESLVNQTLRDIEIILVDDKSPDGSAALCDEWAKKDGLVRVIHKTVNEGLGYARNTGIEAASGEYITFPDSDDYLELETLERLYDYAKKDNLDAVYCEFNTDDYPGFHAISYPDGIYKGRKALESVMLEMIGAEPEYQSDVKFQVSAAKVLYSLDTIKKNNLRFVSERQIISEDLIWNLEFLNVANSIRTTSDRFYHYCLNQASLSHTYRPDRYVRLCEMAEFLKNFTKCFEDKDAFSLRLRRTTLFYLRTYVLSMVTFKNNKAIRDAVCSQTIQTILKNYPISRMPFRYKMLYYTLKFRFFSLLKFFVIGIKANNKKRTLVK